MFSNNPHVLLVSNRIPLSKIQQKSKKENPTSIQNITRPTSIQKSLSIPGDRNLHSSDGGKSKIPPPTSPDLLLGSGNPLEQIILNRRSKNFFS